MRYAYCHELKLLVKNKIYLIVLTAFLCYALFAAGMYAIELHIHTAYILDEWESTGALSSLNPGITIHTLYCNWLGGRNGWDIFATFFYYFAPVFAVIPFSASLLSESKSGYIRSMVTRIPRRTYFLAKYLATFFSGFSLVFLALSLNFLAVACFHPAYLPSPWLYDRLGGMVYGGAFVSLLFKHPLLYSIIYMVIPSVFMGLWATVPMALSFFIKNKYVILNKKGTD